MRIVYMCVYIVCVCMNERTPTECLNTELSLLFCQTLFLSLHYIKRLKAILPLERIIIILQYFFEPSTFTERRPLYRKYVLFMYNMQSLILQFFEKGSSIYVPPDKLIRCTVISTESIFIFLFSLPLSFSLTHTHTNTLSISLFHSHPLVSQFPQK